MSKPKKLTKFFHLNSCKFFLLQDGKSLFIYHQVITDRKYNVLKSKKDLTRAKIKSND